MPTVVAEDTRSDEQQVQLGSLQPGDAFRFAHDTYEDAINHGLVWLVVSDQKNESDRVTAVALSGMEIRRFDDDRYVVKHVVIPVVEHIHRHEERHVHLNSLQPGDAFRFARDTLETAKSCNQLWFVVPDVKKEKERVTAVTLSGLKIRKFDTDRHVVKQQVTFSVRRNT